MGTVFFTIQSELKNDYYDVLINALDNKKGQLYKKFITFPVVIGDVVKIVYNKTGNWRSYKPKLKRSQKDKINKLYQLASKKK